MVLSEQRHDMHWGIRQLPRLVNTKASGERLTFE